MPFYNKALRFAISKRGTDFMESFTKFGVLAMACSRKFTVLAFKAVLIALFFNFVSASIHAEPPVKIILDTDFGDDGDDLAALAVMHHLADLGEIEILAIGQSNSRWDATAAIDVINTYYGRPDLPVGQVNHKTHEGDQYSSFLAENYEHNTDLKAVPKAVDVYRQVLASAPDKSVKFVVVGFKSNMLDFLDSQPDDISPLTGIELMREKVILVADMAGKYPSGEAKDAYNFMNFGKAKATAKQYVEKCPVPMLFAGVRTGGIKVGMRLRKLDSPVGKAMDLKLSKGWKHDEEYQAGFDLAALLIAARGADRYFNMKQGCNVMDEGGGNIFHYNRNCSHSHIDTENQKVPFAEIGEMLEEMMLAGPQ